MPGINAALNKPFNRQNSTHIRAGPHALPRQLLLHRLKRLLLVLYYRPSMDIGTGGPEMALLVRIPCSTTMASLHIPVQAFVAPIPPLTPAISP